MKLIIELSKRIKGLFLYLISLWFYEAGEANYTTDYRIVNKLRKHIPQYWNGITWKDVPFENGWWDNYSGRYTFENAKQRLYVYMGRVKKKGRGAHSIFETGKLMNITYFDYVLFKDEKEQVLSKYNKYIGRTEFLKNIFPEYFTGANH